MKLVVVVTVNYRGHKARETSLHRRNKNVERALGILNLFTDDVTLPETVHATQRLSL